MVVIQLPKGCGNKAVSCIYNKKGCISLNAILISHRVVSTESGKVVADSWKAAFFEASAKENSVSVMF